MKLKYFYQKLNNVLLIIIFIIIIKNQENQKKLEAKIKYLYYFLQ